MKARDVMSRHVVTLSPGNSAAHAAQMMLDNGMSGLPVVDNDAQLVGMVTEGDLIRRVELGHRPQIDLSTPEACDDFVKSHSWRIEDIMTRSVITVGEETTVEEIAELFHTRKIKQAPVTRNGRIIGLVSRSDLLSVIAQSKPPAIAEGDDALRRSVAARLSEMLRTLNPPTVSVSGGIVHLGGTIRDENERAAIRVIVDGVADGASVVDRMQIAPRV